MLHFLLKRNKKPRKTSSGKGNQPDPKDSFRFAKVVKMINYCLDFVKRKLLTFVGFHLAVFLPPTFAFLPYIQKKNRRQKVISIHLFKTLLLTFWKETFFIFFHFLSFFLPSLRNIGHKYE